MPFHFFDSREKPSKSQLLQLTNAQLSDLCKSRGLAYSSSKDALANRLVQNWE